MTKTDEPKTLADALRAEILAGNRPEWYDGQRAQYQREDEEAAARAKAELDRAVEQEIARLKAAGEWV